MSSAHSFNPDELTNTSSLANISEAIESNLPSRTYSA